LSEAIWFELCGGGSFVQHRVVSLFGFSWRHVADGLEQALVVEPVDPFQCRVFDGFEGSPRPPPTDDLGLVEAIDGLGQGVVITVADTADRGLDAGLGEALCVFDRQVLAAAIAVMDETAAVWPALVDRLF
jgi:hypothetical protein